ncbi:asparagine synthase (glutamine-hydrolyzing) [Aureibacillus halotolerans]|uniref:asparagine synthase (glutamine-hydrolyzing) n=1 Tax=Aureibacillus halotolerans TaxID=1508390 RepID=A0A4R6UAK6_9BACI|nr:asparagine synthase (glutamine-hydrolyzing) [Aureibacillus halotolerans]TDQ42083.1 asparagine synthase (glutamine-hydrolysing) [Aureibacillus halotolerans]
MCGISGWSDWRRDITQEQKITEAMTNTLTKRGPDASGVWSKGHISFGHRRLSVVDLSGGAQPMHKVSGDHTYTMIYNGELYNTEDLRKELVARGHTFRSHSDTEVLLTAYIEWKEACLDRLNGIFAFAIWDEENDHLFCARDRLGVKPFFYVHQDAQLIFASEIKALLAHPSVAAVADLHTLHEVLALGPSRTPGSGVFRDINELRPAHYAIWTKEGLKVKRYWNVVSKSHFEDVHETSRHVRSLFVDAVERQLVSDVPLATFLSGGLDSSSITAIAANHYKANNAPPLHTFSVDYEDNESFFTADTYQPNSDGFWIQQMTEAFGTVHHRCVIKNDTLADLLKEAVEVRDLPGMADIDSSLLWFCKEIKKEATVGLSGECADEIFGGYPWFHRPSGEGTFPWMHSLALRESLLNASLRKHMDLSAYVQQRYMETVNETPRLEGEKNEETQRRQLFYVNMLWFMTTLLDRKDRMSMGASLEVRVPFADHRLVEYVWNIPWEMKMYGNQEKGILRKALEGLLPNDVLYRKKSPYPKTHHPAYTNAMQDWIRTICKDPNAPLFEILDKNAVQKLVEQDPSAHKVPWFGQLMKGPQLLAHLGQINHWLDHYQVRISV